MKKDKVSSSQVNTVKNYHIKENTYSPQVLVEMEKQRKQ